jgi:hypothetical protein
VKPIREAIMTTLPAAVRRGLPTLGLLALFLNPAAAQDAGSRATMQPPTDRGSAAAGRGEARLGRADFAREAASADARHVADWVVHSGDNRGLPFLIVDKTNARVFVFDRGGNLHGAAPALLGTARGDHSVPGIGERHMSRIRVHERTTPAGRFVAEPGKNLQGEDIVWVDYDSAVSLHRVRATNPRERRLERLASPTPADNRITYGCINVPVGFYETVVRPVLGRTRGIVYVLPEVRPVRAVFGSYDVNRAGSTGAGRGARAPGYSRVSAQP